MISTLIEKLKVDYKGAVQYLVSACATCLQFAHFLICRKINNQTRQILPSIPPPLFLGRYWLADG